jgi:hypothetical protein
MQCPLGNYDACEVCGGDDSTCTGCDGVVNSGVYYDACLVCGGDGFSCSGCDGVAGSTNGVGSYVGALCVFGGKLYVGGGFTTVGGTTSANRIAVWDGSTWSNITVASSNGLSGAVNVMAANGSSTLYIGGGFGGFGDNSGPVGNIVRIGA